MEPDGLYSESIDISSQFGMSGIPQESSIYEHSNPPEPNSSSFGCSHQQDLMRTSRSFIDNTDYHQHFDELLTIKASPGFRLLDTKATHASLTIYPNDFDQLDSKVSELQTIIQSSIRHKIAQSLQKVECYKDFLGNNPIFKVYRKLQNDSNEHQYCCKRMIDRLKELDQNGQANEYSVEALIRQEIQLERQLLKHQIDYIKTEIVKILHEVKEESHPLEPKQELPTIKQPIVWSSAIIDDQDCYLKEQEQYAQMEIAQHTSYQVKIEQQPDEVCKNVTNNRRFKQPQKFDNTFREIHAYEDDRILASFMSAGNDQRDNSDEIEYKVHSNKLAAQFEESSIQNEASQLSTDEFTSKKQPKGVQFVEPDILVVRNIISKRYKEFFRYISQVHHIKHIIIENCDLATAHYINTMITQSKNIKGIHIHCSFKFNPKFLDISKLQYMSFLPNYRFIRIIDRDTYFCNVKKAILPKKVEEYIGEIIEKPIFNNMYICRNIHPPIRETVEQLHFLRMENDSRWSLRYQTLFQIETPKKLLVITFQNIIFKYSSACFKTIYRKYKELHTIAFRNCQGYQSKGVKQLRYLRSDQLKNLQISGDGLEKKIALKPDAVDEIFRHYTLETLILTNIQFVDMMKRSLLDSSGFKSMYRLNFLTHLNLYSSQPICDDFLKYIFKSSVKNMETLNLGFAQLTPNAVTDLSYFERLENLCLDYTCFGDAQLLQITRRMTKLKQLSVQNLNGSRNYRLCQDYGLVTPYFFEHLASKDLRYLNVFNCHALREYRWSKFNHIECIRINKGLLSHEAMHFMRAKGTQFLIEEGDAEQIATEASDRMSDNDNDSQEVNGLSKKLSEPNIVTNLSKLQEKSVRKSLQEDQLSTNDQTAYEPARSSQKTMPVLSNFLADSALPAETNQESSSDMLQEEN